MKPILFVGHPLGSSLGLVAALETLKISYQFARVAMPADLKSAAYKNLNDRQQTPVLMLPDGTITNASVARSSGDSAFDGSAVSAVRKVGRIPEMQQLDRATFDQLYRQRRAVFKPEDLSL